ncbi:hypothetical protein B0H10DRAFT_1937910 [Mycena sp. CBHHK59/15]|nr:hypothetical protein B0H10DRAFT_1937910 [Mycena sp. CBHHK59/15]
MAAVALPKPAPDVTVSGPLLQYKYLQIHLRYLHEMNSKQQGGAWGAPVAGRLQWGWCTWFWSGGGREHLGVPVAGQQADWVGGGRAGVRQDAWPLSGAGGLGRWGQGQGMWPLLGTGGGGVAAGLVRMGLEQAEAKCTRVHGCTCNPGVNWAGRGRGRGEYLGGPVVLYSALAVL